jgi:8-oxo-dGTP diphosphatase
MTKVVDVAVGVIERPDGQVLLALRPPGRPYEGYWEFPGGKVEAGEAIADALARELHEELGIDEVVSVPWIVVHHAYPHATVRLFFRRVRHWQGAPVSREGQALAWRPPGDLGLAPLLPASLAPIRWLSLPPIYRLSCAGVMGREAFEQALDRALTRHEQDAQTTANPPLWLQVREPDLAPADFKALCARLVDWRTHRPLRLILSSRHPLDALQGLADGVHLTSRDLLAAVSRPSVEWVGASCHDAAQVSAAADLGCDFAVVGPVAPTASHPGADGIGWSGFAQAVQGTRLPIYALGGMAPADLESARRAGAQGVALMRAAWR